VASSIGDGERLRIRLSGASEVAGPHLSAAGLGMVVDSPSAVDAWATLFDRAGFMVGLLAVLSLVVSAVGMDRLIGRYVLLGVLPWLALRGPLDRALGLESVFSRTSYVSPLLGPLSSSAGVLALTGAFLLLLAVVRWHHPPGRRHAVAWLVAIPLLAAAPYGLRELGRGIIPPAGGVPALLWLSWHLALLTVGAALLALAAGLLRRGDGAARSWPTGLAPLAAVLAAFVGVLAYSGRPAWPTWYTLVWIPALALVARPARRIVVIVAIGAVAGSGATLMTWGAGITGRTELALRDIASLGTAVDTLARPALVEFAGQVRSAHSVTSATLYRLWRSSRLRQVGYPARLTVWERELPVADVRLDALGVDDSALARLATGSEGDVPDVTTFEVLPGVHHAVAVRLDTLHAVTVLVGPRSQLVAPAPLGRLLETGPERFPLYRLHFNAVPADRETAPGGRFRREGWALRATRPVAHPTGPYEANVFIPLGRSGSLYVRGVLLILVDTMLVWLLWVAAERIAGVPRRRPPWRATLNSYRTRLAVALAVFFIAPAAALAGISLRQSTAEARQSRDLVLQRVLRDAIVPVASLASPAGLIARAGRVDADLALYSRGALVVSSDPLLVDLAVFPRLLDPAVYHAIYIDGDLAAAGRNGGAGRTGYASVSPAPDPEPRVLATVAPASDRALADRQADVGFALALITILGMVAALMAARLAAQALSRPVSDLREAALAFGRGQQVPTQSGQPPLEFAPVFDAFSRMASDIRASQTALEAARRRTELVLATVSTGVLALDADGRILLANQQAVDALGISLQSGDAVRSRLPGAWARLGPEVTRVLEEGGEGSLDVESGDRQYAVRLASLVGGGDGVVVAITDVTGATRAARVLAWADVANQVAHAIKNPLTPLRLGVQHLERVREERPEQLDRTLQQTSARILAEIERLDAIARAFARFAAPAEAALPLEAVQVPGVLREVADLYRLAPDVAVVVEPGALAPVQANRDELVEVLVNLCDNARNAGARTIELRWTDPILFVRDDGQGIAPEHLGRIFEPRFSTTSSGSGLGLAIVRRLVEGWGAEVSVESQPGAGASFRIRFPDRAA
jgi:signal transduction histidine kinase